MVREIRGLHELRLKRLLAAGYFPAELPPPFTTRDYARHAVEFSAKWDAEAIRKFWTAPEHYSIPRYGQARRKLSIVNPINQLHISDLLAENWDVVQGRMSRSKISEFRPEITSGGGRAVSGVDFNGVARRRAEILAGYGRYVKVDIARFYASIYTHSIAWSVSGKGWVKGHFSSKEFKKSFSNLLDKAISAGQLGQTTGIPIGPDTSRIISELIATEVEIITQEHLPDLDRRAVRYVDDMLIGLTDGQAPEAVLSKFAAALYEYELEINAEKTSVHGLGYPHAPEWIHYVRTFEISPREQRQREEIDAFFEQSVYLADANPRDNVLLFAAKRAASFPVVDGNWNHLVRWLMYCARRAPSCLSFIVEELAVRRRQGRAMPDAEVREYIHHQLPRYADAGHTAEVSWLIFWAREFGIAIGVEALEQVTALRSSVVCLLTLDLMQRGLVVGPISTAHWQTFADVPGLKSEMWLAAYEVTKKRWWPGPVRSTFVTSHPFFADLWNNDVEFYDVRRRARPRVGPEFFGMVARANALEVAVGGGYPT